MSSYKVQTAYNISNTIKEINMYKRFVKNYALLDQHCLIVVPGLQHSYMLDNIRCTV